MSESLFEQALDRVGAAIGRLDEAAREEHVEPDSYLGQWTAAVKELCEAQLAVERLRLAETRGHLAAARGTADTLLETGRLAVEELRLETRKIDRYIEVAEARVAEKLAESARRMAGLLAQEIKGVMVIRAKAYNRERAAGLAGVSVLAFLAVLLAGVVLDRTTLARRDPEPVEQACRGHISREPGNGKLYCVLEVPPDGHGGTR